MEAPIPEKAPIQYTAPAEHQSKEAADAKADLLRVLRTPGARRRLRNATTQIQTFTPPEGTQTA